METHAYRAVIFDMDGTLLDTIDDIADSMNQALRKLGLPAHPVARYLDFIGDGIEVMAMKALPDMKRSPQTMIHAVNAMREEYASRWSNTSRAFDGIAELLDGLEEKGIRISILTNKIDAFAKAMAARLLPDWSFDEVRGLTPDCPRKPDPAGALLCAESMGVNPGQCILVGDSAIDMQTAVSAGMVPVGALWGYQDRERLMAGGAGVLISDPRELLGYFP